MITYRDFFDFIFNISALIREIEQNVTLEDNLTIRQYYILDLISKYNSLEMSKLHPLLKVDKSTTNRLLAPLFEKNLISRVKSTQNHRTFKLSLTESGKQVHKISTDDITLFFSSIEEKYNISSMDMLGVVSIVISELEEKRALYNCIQ